MLLKNRKTSTHIIQKTNPKTNLNFVYIPNLYIFVREKDIFPPIMLSTFVFVFFFFCIFFHSTITSCRLPNNNIWVVDKKKNSSGFADLFFICLLLSF